MNVEKDLIFYLENRNLGGCDTDRKMDKPKLISGPTGPHSHGYKMCMIRYMDGTVKSITWHKYVYECVHGRQPSGIHIHHKNENKRDDSIENLEAKTIGDHCRDHLQKPIPTQTYICPWCDTSFERDDSRVRHNQGSQKNAGPFCNRSCGAS